VVARREIDRLHDLIYRVEAALDDVEADLAGTPGPTAWKAAFLHLADAARDLRGVTLEPEGA
jgi:hypothetical protein